MGNFIIFILILFVLASVLRVDFFFTILYLFVGVYLASRFWSRQMLKKLEITRTLPGRAFLGERVPVTLSLKNLGPLPVPWLLLNDTFSTVLSSPAFFREVISLPGKGSYSGEYVLTARRRGHYQIGPLILQSGDLLGIDKNLSRSFEANSLIVYPKILPLARLGLPTYSPQVILPTPIPLFRDSTRVIGVKNYSAGDNPRHIHWPATAATGRVLVKQFQTAIARETTIFLNMALADYGRPGQAGVAIELAIVVAASLANHVIMREELPVGLITTAHDPLTGQTQHFRLSPGKGQAHLMQILEVLARVEGLDEAHFLAGLRQEAVRLAWGTTVVIITSAESEELLKTLLLLKRSGFHVTLVLVQPAAYAYTSDSLSQGLGLPIFKIKREQDIEAWLPVR